MGLLFILYARVDLNSKSTEQTSSTQQHNRKYICYNVAILKQ